MIRNRSAPVAIKDETPNANSAIEFNRGDGFSEKSKPLSFFRQAVQAKQEQGFRSRKPCSRKLFFSPFFSWAIVKQKAGFRH